MLFKRGGIYYYEFAVDGRRYRASTKQTRWDDAAAVERQARRRARRQARGLPPDEDDLAASPAIQDFAPVFLAYQARRGRQVERLARTLRIVLQFWGRAPEGVTRTRAAPYHDLRLADPIRDPAWLERFEAWMTQRQVTRSARKGETGRQSLGRVVSASARNHYRSAMSGLYRAALRPQYRGRTGVTRNPWLDVERDRPRRRTARLTAEQIAAWIAEASPHVRLALAIGVLAPKLRASNILALEWRDVDFAHKVIVIRAPKIAHLTGQEQVAPLSPALEQILQRAHARRGTCPNVIAWRDEPVQDIKRGLQGAAERAGVPFGLAIGGATFHTLRHYAATVLAALGVPEGLRKDTMGHREIRTTQIYTHLMPEHERGPLALLAEATPLGESVGVILGGREKWTREKSGRFARFPRAVTSPKRARKAR